MAVLRRVAGSRILGQSANAEAIFGTALTRSPIPGSAIPSLIDLEVTGTYESWAPNFENGNNPFTNSQQPTVKQNLQSPLTGHNYEVYNTLWGSVFGRTTRGIEDPRLAHLENQITPVIYNKYTNNPSGGITLTSTFKGKTKVVNYLGSGTKSGSLSKMPRATGADGYVGGGVFSSAEKKRINNLPPHAWSTGALSFGGSSAFANRSGSGFAPGYLYRLGLPISVAMDLT